MKAKFSPSAVLRMMETAAAERCMNAESADFTTPRAFTDENGQVWNPLLITMCLLELKPGAMDEQILLFFNRKRKKAKRLRRLSHNQRKKHNKRMRRKSKKIKNIPEQTDSQSSEDPESLPDNPDPETFLKWTLSRAFRNMDHRTTTSSFVQARQKIKSSVFKDVYTLFTQALVEEDAEALDALETLCIAIDGSNLGIAVNFDEEGNIVETRGKVRAALHLNAATCLNMKNIILDAEIQSACDKNEQAAALILIQRIHERYPDKKLRFVMDRGYFSYKLLTYCVKNDIEVLFRMKYNTFQKLSNGNGMDESMDMIRDVTLTNTKKLEDQNPERYKFVSKNSLDVNSEYEDGFLISGLRLVSAEMTDEMKEADRNYSEEGAREEDKDRNDKYTGFTYLATNIPQSVLDTEEIVEQYYARWACETTYGLLKYKTGLSGFHSRKQNQIEQEVWISLMKYNASCAVTSHYAEQILKKERRLKKKRKSKESKLQLPPSQLAVEKSKVPAEGNGYIRKISFSAVSRCMYYFMTGQINERDFYYEMKLTVVYTIPGRHMPRGNLAKPYKGFQWLFT